MKCILIFLLLALPVAAERKVEVSLKNGSKKEIRTAAAQAYAKNQKISVKRALTVFADLGE